MRPRLRGHPPSTPTPMSAPDLDLRFPLRDETVQLPGGPLTLLAAAGAEELAGGEEGDELPYWAEIWPAGIALARYLAEGPLARGPVLELGAGVGVVGLALARRGVDVVQTDLVPAALRVPRFNTARNAALDPTPQA